MVGSGLSGLVRDLSALCCVESFHDGIEIEPFAADVLKQACCKYGFRDATRRNQTAVFSMAECSCCVVCGAMVG